MHEAVDAFDANLLMASDNEFIDDQKDDSDDDMLAGLAKDENPSVISNSYNPYVDIERTVAQEQEIQEPKAKSTEKEEKNS